MNEGRGRVSTEGPSGGTEVRSLSRDYAWYTAANLSNVAAGLVSLPVLARLLSAHEFGIMGFFEPLALLWTATLKGGFQHSLLRFYPADLGRGRLPPDFLATLVWWPQATSLGLTSAAGLLLVAWHLWFGVPHFFYLVALLAWCQLESWSSLFLTLLGARRDSGATAGFTIAARWAGVVSTLTALALLERTAIVFQWARVAGGLVVTAVLFAVVARIAPPARSAPERSLLSRATAYGVPMSLSELASVIHDQIDRLLLRAYLPFSAVGLYTLNYSVAQYPGALLASGFSAAFSPVANRTYDSHGAPAFTARAREALRPLLYLAAATLAALIGVSTELLTLVVGNDKASPIVFLWIAATYLMTPAAVALTYGLTLRRRVRALLTTTLLSAAINVSANVLLIPTHGIQGAAIATAISFVFLWGTRLLLTPRELVPLKEVGDVMRPLSAGLVAVSTIWLLDLARLPPQAAVVVGSLTAIGVVGIMGTLFDRELRRQCRAKLTAVVGRVS